MCARERERERERERGSNRVVVGLGGSRPGRRGATGVYIGPGRDVAARPVPSDPRVVRPTCGRGMGETDAGAGARPGATSA